MALLLAFESVSIMAAPSLEVDSITTNNTFSTPLFNTGTFTAAFATPPVVIPIVTQQGSDPCTSRLRNVTTTTFDIACVEPPGNDGPHVPNTVHYVAIEPGVHSFDLDTGGTITIAAGCHTTSTVQHNCGAGCGATGWDSINFGHTFSSTPTVLTHLRTMNSESGAPPGGPSQPYLTSVVRGGSIGLSGFQAAIERSEVAAGTVVNEELCWVAMEPVACATIEFGSGRSANLSVQNTAVNIDGWNNGCNAGEGVGFGSCFSAAPIVTAAKITRNEADGGWPRRCNLNATQARFTIDEDRSADGERNHVNEQLSVWAFDSNFATTPVSLASARADYENGELSIRWQTRTEVANAGFHIYLERFGRFERATTDVIPSHVVDSTLPQQYSATLNAAHATRFMIADIDLTGREHRHGPFEFDQDFGSQFVPKIINWGDVRRQRNATQAAERVRAPASVEPTAAVELHVDATGLYRITYEALLNAGFTAANVSIHDVALVTGRRAVARRIISVDDRFGPGDSVEFLGEGIEGSLYTRTRVYQLRIEPSQVRRVPRHIAAIPAGNAPDWYMAKQRIAKDVHYAFSAPGRDPWYMSRLFTTGQVRHGKFSLNLDNYVAEAHAMPTLKVALWGMSRWPQSPDHHYRVLVNGEPIADRWFDGTRVDELFTPLAEDLLTDGTNDIIVELPADTGTPHEILAVEAIEVRYPRRFEMRDGKLAFYRRGPVFDIGGLGSEKVIVYRARQGKFDKPERVASMQLIRGESGLGLRIPGDASHKYRYFLAETNRIDAPRVRAAISAAVIPDHAVDLLVVAHGQFIDALDDFVTAREQQGLRVHVVDVAAIYARESGGSVTPNAIRRFIATMSRRTQLKYVLLVGGDTYDYFDNLDIGSVSFIPTPYAATDDIVNFAPADSLLTDVDRDGFGDLPIGRWPVRTVNELTRIIDKTLRYDAGGHPVDGYFVADGADPQFSVMLNNIRTELPPDWQVDTLSVGEGDIAATRQSTLDALNAGPRLSGYFGHSGPSQWSFDGLFFATDAAALNNIHPTIVNQWGCWNTYHVEPRYDTLGHAFLLENDAGAAAVLGASTLTKAVNEHALGRLLMQRIARPGIRVGDALQAARRKLRRVQPDAHDVLKGWILLGDPTLRVNP